MTYADADLLAEELGVPADSVPEYYGPRYNIAPMQKHLILQMDNETRELLPARWGLVNSWAKDNKNAAKQINARAETVAARPAYRAAFKHRRCIIPADGFYEWSGDKKARMPFRFHRPDGKLLLFAGLTERWEREPGQWEQTFTIITTTANKLMSSLHDRMPVILDDRDADLWMFKTTPAEQLTKLLVPAAEDVLMMDAASPLVNKVANDGPELLGRAPGEEPPSSS